MKTIDWTHIEQLAPGKPILIAGPTASGKSDLALKIAENLGGVVLNADALQVYSNWRVLSARPSATDEARAKHRLYGHIDGKSEYSVGHWLRDIKPYLDQKERPIIVGGTGLYFTALTQGLAPIPPIPAGIRRVADDLRHTHGLASLLADLDPETKSVIDIQNPMRVQRAWEVLKTTGQSILTWQSRTPSPDLPLSRAFPILFDLDKSILNARIATRFQKMIALGALDEARENLHDWDAANLSSNAIGAPELIAYLQGKTDLATATELATIATRQFAKRQRTWFRSKMKDWNRFFPNCS